MRTQLNRWRASRRTARTFVSSLLIILSLMQLSSTFLTKLFADACSDSSAAAASSSSGLSACQRQIYQEGIYMFDVADNSSTNCVVGTSVNLGGSDHEQTFFNFVTSQTVDGGTVSAVAAAALMGNIKQESGFDPTDKNSIGAYGIVQWLGGRYDNLVKFAQAEGTTKSDFGTQVQFMWKELTTSYKASTLTPLLKTSDITAATKIVFDNYEVAGDSTLPTRTTYAKQFLAQYGGGSPTAGSDQGNGSTASTTSGTDGTCNSTGPGQDSQFVDGFTVYSQYDPAWKDNPYGTSTIGDSGCGPSAMAMIITALTGQSVTPADTAAFAGSHGLYEPGVGTKHIMPTIVAPHWGLKAAPVAADVAKITAILQSGGMVIGAAKGPLPFTSAGHYIAIRGVTANGSWKIGDSAHKDTSSKDWDPQDILGPIIASGHQGSLYAITKGAVSQ